MKKNYIEPVSKVYLVKHVANILVTSDAGGVENGCSLGDEYSADDVSYSKDRLMESAGDEW